MAANAQLYENVRNKGLRDIFLNRTFGMAGLAEGTNANTIKTSNAVSYSINGQLYYKAATDNIAMTACAAQADLTACYYLVTINASGTVKITKGTDGVAALPEAPANEAILGAFKIVTSGATFTSGTTDLGAATVTDTYTHFGLYPQDGLVAGLTFA